MEKLLRPYEKEYMRMVMLKHEETFKEQVCELHRIYRIQKTLMKSIESGRSSGSFSLKNNHHGNMHQNSRMRLDLERPADQEYNIAESDHHGNIMFEEVIDESEIELTLGPRNSGFGPQAESVKLSQPFFMRYVGYPDKPRRIRNMKYLFFQNHSKKKHGTPVTSDSGPSFSSSSTESSHMNRTSSSRTKQTTYTTRDEFSGRQLGLLQVTNMTLGYQNGGKNSIDLEEQLKQERLKQPPWLFRVLSMNMT